LKRTDKREALIQAALELVGERGFHGAPVALIADRAGVAAGTIYRYFDNKDSLIKGIHAALEQQILDAVTVDYPENQPVRDRFLHVGRKLVGYFISSPLQFRFLEQYYNSPYGVASRRAKLFGKKKKNLIVRLFEEALDRKLIKPLPLPILFALTFGPLIDISRDHILEFVTLNERLIEETVEACWGAIQRPRAVDAQR